MNDITTTILKSINSVIAGKEAVVEKVLMAILSGGHVLLEDVPGVGKTTLAISFARTLGLDTRRVQFTSDTMPSDILGFSVYNRDTGNFDYKPGAVMTNLLLADEINRTSSKTQSALLEAIEESSSPRRTRREPPVRSCCRRHSWTASSSAPPWAIPTPRARSTF